ncbi:UNVERIFIED_CONTAM: hypothetical protein GTU68_043581 [Idotea baltica]|nr:hypothetical protein [Idotea baltica]
MLHPDGTTRRAYQGLQNGFFDDSELELKKRAVEAEALFRRTGIVFNVYGDAEGQERLIPFDIVPRILDAAEWDVIERGVIQRVDALNQLVYDLYHDRDIVDAGIVPVSQLARNEAYLPQMIGVSPPGNIYSHIAGVDLVRTGADEFVVLEDNLRTPSGVSYMLENRETMLHLFPQLFEETRVRRVHDYAQQLRWSLEASAPAGVDNPTVCVLTPGIHNSAYFEHAFLADEMGVELVEGHDLQLHNGRIAMRTTTGFEPVDVIYRRIDDAFIDPLTFRADSALGVSGLMDVYRAGRVTLANAPGAGIADDKAVYSYVPDIIRFYCDEEPILNNVETWRCSEPDQLGWVLDNLEELVVKEVHGSGGYGMLIGPTSSAAEIEQFRAKLMANPDGYIAQPTLALSTVPILTDAGLAPRHVDLRPFVLSSPESIRVTPGGLTRVAMVEGSLVVNSSQGGGTKDTWVLEA